MPGGITTFGAGAWLSIVHNIIAPAAGYYIALATSEPGIDFDGDVLADIEPPTLAGYGRQFYALDNTHWASDGEFLENLLDIDFGFATDSWGIPTHYALCTAATSGDLYAWGELGDTFTIAADYGVLLPAGGIVIQLATLDVAIAI